MRLLRDTTGNVLALMAVMLIPLVAFSGSAIDMARLYSVKTRLQQACDSGVLAGRKFMADAGETTLDSNAATQAQNFFNNNLKAGWFKTTSTSFTPTVGTNSQVTAKATAAVPMTIMAMFGQSARTITVNCAARFDVADTDIIFVLDTTGSMACAPADSDSTCGNYVGGAGTTSYARPTDSASGNDSMTGYPGTTAYYVPEKSNSRISALRSAVLNFFDTMTANIDASTHIRYGFVTYTSTVNAGKAVSEISPTYMVGGAGNANPKYYYQSRYQNGDSTSSSSNKYSSVSQSDCASSTYNYPKTAYSSDGTATSSSATYVTASQNTSPGCRVTVTTYTPNWVYPASTSSTPSGYALDVSGFVAGNTVTDPTKVTGATSRWTGCLEERLTTAGTTTFNQGNLPADLDPNRMANTDATRWAPMWPEVIYARNGFGSTAQDTSTGDDSYNDPNLGSGAYLRAGFVSCGKPVLRLASLTRAQVSTYVNAADFKPIGGTYHDTGMIWGTRLLSPKGIFANDTAAWPNRPSPNRVIVFLTDGDMEPSQYIYGMYGLEYYDKRVSGGDYANLKSYHNARFLAECTAAKSFGVDVWTVTIGSAATTQMQSCATTTAQALYTTDGNGLSTVFAQIAKAVAMLRLSV